MDRQRITFLSILVMIPLGGLGARLVQVQVASPDAYIGHLLARKSSVEVVKAPRGSIYDCAGRVLAEDLRSFDCFIVLEEHEKSPGPLAVALGLTPAELQAKIDRIHRRIDRIAKRRPKNEYRRIIRRERRTPYLLQRDIPFETAVALEINPDIYPGTVIREGLHRDYPQGRAGCHIVGYLGKVTANETEFRRLWQNGYFTGGFEEHIGQDSIIRLYRRGLFHDEMIGRMGLERQYENDLRGRAGLAILERIPGTSAKQFIEIQPPVPGKTLELTIDIRLQAEIEKVLQGPHHAAAVVIDPRTGALLALASSHGYDPNIFIPPFKEGQADAVKRVLADRENKPLLSRAFGRQAQLGSIFKVTTSVAALESGKVTPESEFPCAGPFIPGVNAFRCWIWNHGQGAHGQVPLWSALEQSCNPFFYECGKRCGMATVADWAMKLGYGDRTGLDLPGELRGVVPRDGRFHGVLSLAIGQHELMVTPVQVGVMMSAIANGGRRVTPHLVRGSAPDPEPIGIRPSTLEPIRRGLKAVVHGRHGTARTSPLADLKKLTVAGKTSSAQTGAGRDSHAWFAGYAPHDDPRYVVVVFVEYGGSGGRAAGPPAARIFELLEKREE